MVAVSEECSECGEQQLIKLIISQTIQTMSGWHMKVLSLEEVNIDLSVVILIRSCWEKLSLRSSELENGDQHEHYCIDSTKAYVLLSGSGNFLITCNWTAWSQYIDEWKWHINKIYVISDNHLICFKSLMMIMSSPGNDNWIIPGISKEVDYPKNFSCLLVCHHQNYFI